MENEFKFGLPETANRKIKKVFSRFPEIEKVIIYGSRAKKSPKPGSDIDLTLIGKNTNTDILLEISHQIDDLLLPYSVDLSIFHHINNKDLLDHIERIGQVFYIANEST